MDSKVKGCWWTENASGRFGSEEEAQDQPKGTKKLMIICGLTRTSHYRSLLTGKFPGF